MGDSIRESMEETERRTLSPYATLSSASKGRQREEAPCDIRTCFMRDRDRIVHCKAFRRLKDKTQVFLSPQGDHYRTRLMHTLEVSQIARTMAKALRLNEDLVEAIALGHDLGHTPFGHAGERALNEICPLGFEHSRQSLRVVDVLEKNGKGLNLTAEVRDGILCHQTESMPSTLEGQTVRLADKFAYIHHDMDDGIRAGILREEDVPEELRALLGGSIRERLNTLIHDVIEASSGRDGIFMSDPVYDGMMRLRTFMHRNLYTHSEAKREEGKASRMLKELYLYYVDDPSAMSAEYRRLITEDGWEKERVVCDYISGMTDQYSIAVYRDIHIPRLWEKY